MIRKNKRLIEAILGLMHKPPYVSSAATAAYWVHGTDYHLLELEKTIDDTEKAIAEYRAALAEARALPKEEAA